MDSWTLQGDSYSFLRSAPRTFSLCHRDGTPNHVELFDIINTPSQRSVISETTCLCDIFGDDCEAASLSSSPASAAFIPQQTEVEGRVVTSPIVDDNNDSSGSYHTANSSSGEEGLEDANEKQNCSDLQNLTEEQIHSEFLGTSNSGSCTYSPLPHDQEASPDCTVCDVILSSTKNNTPQTHRPEGSCPLYSSSPSNLSKHFSDIESRTSTPSRHSSLSHHTPTPESKVCVRSSPSYTPQLDFLEISSEPGAILKDTITSVELPSNNLITPLNFQPTVISTTDILSSPQPVPRGRISVHDLFSRGSTPDLDGHPQTPEPISSPINVQEDITVSAELDIVTLKTNDTVSTPGLQHTSSSPVNVSTLSPRPQSISSEIVRLSSPSPSRLSPTSPHSNISLSSQEKYISTPPASRTPASPSVTSLSPSPGCSPIFCMNNAASPEIRITASSPELENKSSSETEVPASPQITNISYSVVQAHQPSPTFSEERCLSGSPIPEGYSRSRYSSTSSLLSEVQSELLSEQNFEDRQTIHLKTPSPETRNQSPLHFPSLSPPSSCDLSAASQAVEPLSKTPTENKLDCCTFEYTSVNQQNIQSLIKAAVAEESTPVPSSRESNIEDTDEVITTFSVSPNLSLPIVPFSESEKTDITSKTVKLAFDSNSAEEDLCYNPGNPCLKKSPIVVNYPITAPVLSANYKDILPAPKEIIAVTVKTIENTQPQLNSYFPKSNHTFNTKLTPKPFSRQQSETVALESKGNLGENMACHIKKRRTPSPPITRFTPVHIIAPEKPYRQWQARGRSPSQVTTLRPSDNLKKVLTNTEIPHLDPVNNSQEDRFRNRKPQEIESGLQLQESAIDQELDCEVYKERKGEEHITKQGKGGLGDAISREEQVELSFNAKNRNGPMSRSTAHTGRDAGPGLPTAHSYSENQLTRQSKQQQTAHRLSSQPESKCGRLRRRLQPPVNQHKSTASVRAATNKPGRSSSSSMGSELDEADHEVKWFTDVAFSSLSSPEIDYLDMYNSSHRSSTNVSQPSTQDSPAGINTPWLSYADFRGSTQLLDNDELSLEQSCAYFSDGLDPSKCYELVNFECVDVAVEKEDTKKVRRGVPKRQIQLKRRDTTESKQDESSENSSPGIPLLDNFSLDTFPRETLLRQHSTPGPSRDPEIYEDSPALDQRLTKSKLKKSSSLDESSSKTKMATCLIKSILTKKMQSDELVAGEEPSDLDEIMPTKTDSSKSPKPDMQLLSSSLQSDCSLLSDNYGGRNDTNMKDEVGRQKNLKGKLSHRPSSTNSNRSVTFSIADSEETEAETKTAILKSEFKQTSYEDFSDQVWKETEHEDSTNNTHGNSDPSAEALCTGHDTRTNTGEQEYEKGHTEEQKGVLSYKSKSPNSLSISLLEKKKASLNVCLTPEADENEKVGDCVKDQIEDDIIDDKIKGPIHKVRDVRRIVKNTYNLSFQAASAFPPDETNIFNQELSKKENNEVPQKEIEGQEMKDKEAIEVKMETKDGHIKVTDAINIPQKEQVPYSQPMQIEYKAVCWKEDKNKAATNKKMIIDPQPNTETVMMSDMKPKTQDGSDILNELTAVAEKSQQSLMHQNADRPVPKMPNKEREVSTAIVLIRDNSKSKRSASPSPQEFPATGPASSTGISSTSGSCAHSVSMLLKEKGYQADIGAVVGEGQINKNAPSKHVNSLEIPLQTPTESHRERTFSSSSTGSTVMPGNAETKTIEAVRLDSTMKVHHLPPKSSAEQNPANKQGSQGDFESLKRSDPTFPPRSPAVRRFKPQSIEVKSMSKEANKPEANQTNLGNSSRSQAIEVKSVAKNSQKPIVPPKPNCKFKPLDFGAIPSEAQRVPPASSKSHTEDRSQTIVVSSPTIYRKIPNDSTSNYTRKVAVSSVSSLKPPTSKPTAPSNVSVQPPLSEMDAETDRQQHPGPTSQNSRYTQRHSTLPPAPTNNSGPSISSSVPFDATGHPHQATAQTGPMQSRMPHPHESGTMNTSDDEQSAPVSTTQSSGYIRQSFRRSLSNECSQKRNNMHFYASDDPPSYDDRESFSPLRLPDLPPRSNRYQASSRAPPCSCTAACPSHPGLPHPHSSPHNLTPPGPTLSPGHYAPQPATRPHQQPVAYQTSSPKANPLGPGPPQGLYQPLLQPSACPSHSSLMHAYSAERPLPPAQHMDPRRPAVHRSPQQAPAAIPAAPYPDQGHNHSPGLPHMDPHYLCAPHSLGPSYGSDYGGDSSSIYTESNYGQTPRRVLMDPETGKYFYIEVPVQPLRKMLFDPETGQYVEVLIPQQAMSHSGLYPPSSANYPPLHNTNMYAPAPQYMPYAAPPPQSQPPRYPESSATATMHPHGPGVGYRNPSGQGSKLENQGHPPVDPNYLESMYYVPTGMNASPNPTPPEYYHKHPSMHPNSGSKRS